MSDNIYHSPEKFNLRIVAAIDFAGGYEFDMVVVWENLESKQLLWAQDSGCS